MSNENRLVVAALETGGRWSSGSSSSRHWLGFERLRPCVDPFSNLGEEGGSRCCQCLTQRLLRLRWFLFWAETLDGQNGFTPRFGRIVLNLMVRVAGARVPLFPSAVACHQTLFTADERVFSSVCVVVSQNKNVVCTPTFPLGTHSHFLTHPCFLWRTFFLLLLWHALLLLLVVPLPASFWLAPLPASFWWHYFCGTPLHFSSHVLALFLHLFICCSCFVLCIIFPFVCTCLCMFCNVCTCFCCFTHCYIFHGLHVCTFLHSCMFSKSFFSQFVCTSPQRATTKEELNATEK